MKKRDSPKKKKKKNCNATRIFGERIQNSNFFLQETEESNRGTWTKYQNKISTTYTVRGWLQRVNP
jgi:hypothetical protein